MADKYGTDCGVKGMKNYLHIFIKGAFVLFLIAYLTVLYTSDSAKNVPMEQIAQTMEQDSDITSLNKEARSDLKHYYQTDDRNIDGYFFYKAASPMLAYKADSRIHRRVSSHYITCVGCRNVLKLHHNLFVRHVSL